MIIQFDDAAAGADAGGSAINRNAAGKSEKKWDSVNLNYHCTEEFVNKKEKKEIVGRRDWNTSDMPLLKILSICLDIFATRSIYVFVYVACLRA